MPSSPRTASDLSAGTKNSRIRTVVNHSGTRYLVIGGASFLIDFGLLAVLHQFLSWPLWLATGSAFLASFVFNYSLQRTFSFGSNAKHAGTLVKYVLLLGFNTLATIGIVAMVDQTTLGWGWGKIAATVVTTAWNYFAYRFWVFAPMQDAILSREDKNVRP
jgi:putative flippase GtrA